MKAITLGDVFGSIFIACLITGLIVGITLIKPWGGLVAGIVVLTLIFISIAHRD